MKKFHKTSSQLGFSLAEVAISLGLMAFCLVAVFGLLPVGLQSVKDANEQSSATGAVKRIATLIREAKPMGAGAYTADGNFASAMSWNIGGPATVFTVPMSVSYEVAPAADARLVARVEMLPPANLNTVGRAKISIAWPGTSANWNTTDSRWQNAAGSVTSGLIFLPSP